MFQVNESESDPRGYLNKKNRFIVFADLVVAPKDVTRKFLYLSHGKSQMY